MQRTLTRSALSRKGQQEASTGEGDEQFLVMDSLQGSREKVKNDTQVCSLVASVGGGGTN